MVSEQQVKQEVFISPELKDQLHQLDFMFSHTHENGVMWGFDGSTKYFPRETYIREPKDGKTQIKMRLEKTNNGIILIINSNPFKQQNHLDRSQLEVKEIIPIVKEYISLV